MDKRKNTHRKIFPKLCYLVLGGVCGETVPAWIPCGDQDPELGLVLEVLPKDP